jgi:hypothetical protein
MHPECIPPKKQPMPCVVRILAVLLFLSFGVGCAWLMIGVFGL